MVTISQLRTEGKYRVLHCLPAAYPFRPAACPPWKRQEMLTRSREQEDSKVTVHYAEQVVETWLQSGNKMELGLEMTGKKGETGLPATTDPIILY